MQHLGRCNLLVVKTHLSYAHETEFYFGYAHFAFKTIVFLVLCRLHLDYSKQGCSGGGYERFPSRFVLLRPQMVAPANNNTTRRAIPSEPGSDVAKTAGVAVITVVDVERDVTV